MQLTKTQIAWASQHDWFIGVNSDQTIMVLDELVYRDGSETREIYKWEKSFQELRDWAGY